MTRIVDQNPEKRAGHRSDRSQETPLGVDQSASAPSAEHDEPIGNDLPDIVDVVMVMGRAPEEPAADAEAPRHGAQPFGRSSFFERSTGPFDTPEGVADAHRSEFGKRSQAHRWLSAGDVDPSSPPPPAIADSRLPAHRPHTIRIACPPYSGRPDYSWTRT